MGFIKKVLFILIPITTLIIFVSYGIAIIFGENLDITYLQYSETTEQLIFSWKDYLTNLSQTNILRPFINLGNTFNMVIEPIQTCIEVMTDGHWWDLLLPTETLVKALINFNIAFLNIPIWLLNITLAITQSLNIIIGTLFKLIAINVNADVTLFNIFRAFDSWNLIHGIPAINW